MSSAVKKSPSSSSAASRGPSRRGWWSKYLGRRRLVDRRGRGGAAIRRPRERPSRPRRRREPAALCANVPVATLPLPKTSSRAGARTGTTAARPPAARFPRPPAYRWRAGPGTRPLSRPLVLSGRVAPAAIGTRRRRRPPLRLSSRPARGGTWGARRSRPNAASPRPVSADYLRLGRPVSTKFPRRDRGVAATRLHGLSLLWPPRTGLDQISTSRPRRRRDPSPRIIYAVADAHPSRPNFHVAAAASPRPFSTE